MWRCKWMFLHIVRVYLRGLFIIRCNFNHLADVLRAPPRFSASLTRVSYLLLLSRDIFLHEFVSSLVPTLLSDSLFSRRAARNESTLMEPEMNCQKLEECPEIVHGTREKSRNTRLRRHLRRIRQFEAIRYAKKFAPANSYCFPEFHARSVRSNGIISTKKRKIYYQTASWNRLN